jgi:hypothetical protein
MIELTRAEQLKSDSAIEVAQAIHRINPRYISLAILERFKAELTEFK